MKSMFALLALFASIQVYAADAPQCVTFQGQRICDDGSTVSQPTPAPTPPAAQVPASPPPQVVYVPAPTPQVVYVPVVCPSGAIAARDQYDHPVCLAPERPRCDGDCQFLSGALTAIIIDRAFGHHGYRGYGGYYRDDFHRGGWHR
jgi:hypothetical protein